jgi:DNA-binding NarL/FixJ family response regulator
LSTFPEIPTVDYFPESMSTDHIRVLIVDDHLIVRNGLRLMLGSCPDIHVAGEAPNACDALHWLRENAADVVLCDISLPGRNGLELLKLIKAEWPRLAVLIVTMYQEDLYAVRAVKLGAAGYLTKDVGERVVADAIRTAAAGGRYMTPKVAATLAGALERSMDLLPHQKLSERQFEILRMIGQGKSLNDIADTLNISAKTVTGYRRRLLDKIGASSNAQITRYALEHRLLD